MADVILKDLNGNDQTYEGVEKVKLNTSDGNTQIFSKGDTVENVEIGLDFTRVSTAETDIFPLQTVDGFVEDTEMLIGTYYAYFPNVFEIKEGETYYVKWDGTTYTCKGISASLNGQNFVYLGDGSMLGYEGNNEPFAIIYSPDNGFLEAVAFNDTNTSHEIRVYQISTETSVGDQIINAPEGYLVKSAVIKKPDTLVPENIVKDVEIAGVMGISEGGGSSKPRMEYTYNDNGEIIAAKGIGLTAIPNKFFYENKTIETLDLSECPNLTTIGEYAFYYCSALASIELPNSVTSIGARSFYECRALTSITIPDGVTSISAYTFYNCTSLASITIPDGVTSIGDYAFHNCNPLASITIPDGVTSIGVRAFYNCNSLTSVTIPDGVTSIGENTFYNCTSLASIELPNSVTNIGTSAFYKCSSLETFVIPDSVTTIGGSAFNYCTGLTSITFGSGITTMGSGVLNYSTNVTEIILKEGMTVIGSAFCRYGSNSAKHAFTSIVIPASIKQIGNYAFSNASKLTSATFVDPNGWYVSTSSAATSGTNLTTLTNATTAATYLRSTHASKYWFNGD